MAPTLPPPPPASRRAGIPSLPTVPGSVPAEGRGGIPVSQPDGGVHAPAAPGGLVLPTRPVAPGHVAPVEVVREPDRVVDEAPVATPVFPSSRESKSAGNRKAKLGESSQGTKKRKSSGWRMTERDKVMIEFLARYKVATYDQIAAYLQMDVSNVRHRIVHLEGADLIKVFRGGSRVNLVGATANGMRLLGLSLPVYDPSHSTVRHTLALTDLGIFYEGEGQTVVTEREIRAAWQHGEKSARIERAAEWQSAPVTFGLSDPNHGLYVVPPPFGKKTGLRIPDMVLAAELGQGGAPGSIAVEMELSPKEAWRYKEIVSSYWSRGRDQFRAVLYVTPYRDVMTAVTKAIQEAGADSFMGVRQYTPPTDLSWQ